MTTCMGALFSMRKQVGIKMCRRSRVSIGSLPCSAPHLMLQNMQLNGFNHLTVGTKLQIIEATHGVGKTTRQRCQFACLLDEWTDPKTVKYLGNRDILLGRLHPKDSSEKYF